MDIRIKIIPHDQQRYPTAGDWNFEKNGDLTIRVSKMDNVESEIAVAIHEIREAMLCKNAGISDRDVTNFDVQFEKEREAGLHSQTAEPGDHEAAPYRLQHGAATFVERAFILTGPLSWEGHDRAAVNQVE